MIRQCPLKKEKKEPWKNSDGMNQNESSKGTERRTGGSLCERLLTTALQIVLAQERDYLENYTCPDGCPLYAGGQSLRKMMHSGRVSAFWQSSATVGRGEQKGPDTAVQKQDRDMLSV